MDDEVIQIAEHWYIRATSARTDERTRVLKHDDTFGVFDRLGDVQSLGAGEQGLFHLGTRHLSRLELRIGKVRPLLLSSTVNEANDTLAVDLTNPDLTGRDDAVTLPRGQLHLLRTKFIWQGTCYERLRVSNYGMTPTTIALSIRFDADFVDIFEVRGARRERRGAILPPQLDGGSCVLSYEGLDSVVRRTEVRIEPTPAVMDASSASMELTIAPQEHQTIYVTVSCVPAQRPRPTAQVFEGLQQELARALASGVSAAR